MSVTIRRAVSKDAKAMAELDRICFECPWSEKAFKKELSDNSLAVYLVAEQDGMLLGYVGLWQVEGEGHITNLTVHPDFRRQGIGAKILNELLEITEDNGIDCHTLEVRASNQAAISLYEKFDFRQEGIRKEYYSDNMEDALILWRKK